MNIKKNIFSFFRDYKKVSGMILGSESSLTYDIKMYEAVICAEDKYFFKHSGVSIKSIIRALLKKHGGASTITMQTVRVITGRYDVSLHRKIREALLSFFVEIRCDKVSILNCYLDCSYFGTQLIGVRSALNKYFDGKDNSMSIMDYCFIAALLKRPAPSEFSVIWAYKLNARMAHIKNVISVEGEVILSEITKNTPPNR